MESIKILKSLCLVLAVLVTIAGLTVLIEKKAPAENKETAITTNPPSSSTTESANGMDISDWKTYRNEEVGFEVKYPKEAVIQKEGVIEFKGRSYEQSYVVDIALPFSEGTLLKNKLLKIITEKAPPEQCSNPLDVYPSSIGKVETVYVNGIEFKEEVGSNPGAGFDRQSISYSTTRKDQCITLSLVLIIGSPPAARSWLDFDQEKEIQVFDQILSTLRFTK